MAAALAMAMTAPLAASGQELSRCEARAQAIRTTLDTSAHRTRVWYWAWMATGTALLGGQTILAALTTGDTQKDAVLGAATSVFIPAVLLVHPPSVLSDASLLDTRFDATTVDGRLGDSCVVLPRAEELLRRDAADQALSTGWLAHALVVGGNIAAGLLLGLGFHDWLGAAKQAVVGSVVGELQILTLPTGALRAQGLGLGGSF